VTIPDPAAAVTDEPGAKARLICPQTARRPSLGGPRRPQSGSRARWRGPARSRLVLTRLLGAQKHSGRDLADILARKRDEFLSLHPKNPLFGPFGLSSPKPARSTLCVAGRHQSEGVGQYWGLTQLDEASRSTKPRPANTPTSPSHPSTWSGRTERWPTGRGPVAGRLVVARGRRLLASCHVASLDEGAVAEGPPRLHPPSTSSGEPVTQMRRQHGADLEARRKAVLGP
jgi:hypothetical protein